MMILLCRCYNNQWTRRNSSVAKQRHQRMRCVHHHEVAVTTSPKKSINHTLQVWKTLSTQYPNRLFVTPCDVFFKHEHKNKNYQTTISYRASNASDVQATLPYNPAAKLSTTEAQRASSFVRNKNVTCWRWFHAVGTLAVTSKDTTHFALCMYDISTFMYGVLRHAVWQQGEPGLAPNNTPSAPPTLNRLRQASFARHGNQPCAFYHLAYRPATYTVAQLLRP